jgi:hypothetical protein
MHIYRKTGFSDGLLCNFPSLVDIKQIKQSLYRPGQALRVPEG